jgi:hypothetical protein
MTAALIRAARKTIAVSLLELFWQHPAQVMAQSPP